MKCNKCKAEWVPPAGVNVITCPFCKSPLSQKPSMKNATPEEIMATVIEELGPQVLLDKEKLVKIVSGITAINSAAQTLLLLAIKSNVTVDLYELLVNKSTQTDKKSIVIYFAIGNSLSMNEAQMAVDIFANACLSVLDDENPQKQADSSAETIKKSDRKTGKESDANQTSSGISDGPVAQNSVSGGEKNIGSQANLNKKKFTEEDAHAMTGESIKIPFGYTYIDSFAFDERQDIVTVQIPEGVTGIGEYAFSECENLKSILLPTSLKVIGDSVFNNCKSLIRIKIPGEIGSINDELFFGCTNLASIELPASVKKIGKAAFYNCFKLSDITLPRNLGSISEFAFYHCVSLRYLNLSDSVIKIGSDAFLYCENLVVSCSKKSVAYEYCKNSLISVKYQ